MDTAQRVVSSLILSQVLFINEHLRPQCHRNHYKSGSDAVQVINNLFLLAADVQLGLAEHLDYLIHNLSVFSIVLHLEAEDMHGWFFGEQIASTILRLDTARLFSSYI